MATESVSKVSGASRTSASAASARVQDKPAQAAPAGKDNFPNKAAAQGGKDTKAGATPGSGASRPETGSAAPESTGNGLSRAPGAETIGAPRRPDPGPGGSSPTPPSTTGNPVPSPLPGPGDHGSVTGSGAQAPGGPSGQAAGAPGQSPAVTAPSEWPKASSGNGLPLQLSHADLSQRISRDIENLAVANDRQKSWELKDHGIPKEPRFQSQFDQAVAHVVDTRKEVAADLRLISGHSPQQRNEGQVDAVEGIIDAPSEMGNGVANAFGYNRNATARTDMQKILQDVGAEQPYVLAADLSDK